jgi:hypothetical protein
MSEARKLPAILVADVVGYSRSPIVAGIRVWTGPPLRASFRLQSWVFPPVL